MVKRNKRLAIVISVVLISVILLPVLPTVLWSNCIIRSFDIPAIPKEHYKVPFDLYIANSPSYQVPWTDMQIQEIIEGANRIWNVHDIEIYQSGSINKSRVYLTDNDVLVGRASNNQTKDAISLVEKIISKSTLHNNVTKIILIKSFWNYDSSLNISGNLIGLVPKIFGGKGLNYNNTRVAILADNRNVSWALAHELAHGWGLEDIGESEGRLNLMTHTGCIKDKYYPTVLNQTQYDTIQKNLERLTHRGK